MKNTNILINIQLNDLLNAHVVDLNLFYFHPNEHHKLDLDSFSL